MGASFTLPYQITTLSQSISGFYLFCFTPLFLVGICFLLITWIISSGSFPPVRTDYNDNKSWIRLYLLFSCMCFITWMILSPFLLCNLAIDMVSYSLSILDYTSMLYIFCFEALSPYLLWTINDALSVISFLSSSGIISYLLLYSSFIFHVFPCFQNFLCSSVGVFISLVL